METSNFLANLGLRVDEVDYMGEYAGTLDIVLPFCKRLHQ